MPLAYRGRVRNPPCAELFVLSLPMGRCILHGFPWLDRVYPEHSRRAHLKRAGSSRDRGLVWL